MDKQEVINEIEKIDYQNLKYDSPERMLSEQKQLIIDIIDKLDELQKVKVPECVGELLDYYRKSADVDLLALLICFKGWYFRNDKTSESEEAIDWLVKHPEKFMKAWLDGYEVEEEPKYRIKFPVSYGYRFLSKNCFGQTFFTSAIGKCKNEFTESEIKAMDERYWPFAVPVEEEEV